MSFFISCIYIVSGMNELFLQENERAFLSKFGENLMKGQIFKIGFSKSLLITIKKKSLLIISPKYKMINDFFVPKRLLLFKKKHEFIKC